MNEDIASDGGPLWEGSRQNNAKTSRQTLYGGLNQLFTKSEVDRLGPLYDTMLQRLEQADKSLSGFINFFGCIAEQAKEKMQGYAVVWGMALFCKVYLSKLQNTTESKAKFLEGLLNTLRDVSAASQDATWDAALSGVQKNLVSKCDLMFNYGLSLSAIQLHSLMCCTQEAFRSLCDNNEGVDCVQFWRDRVLGPFILFVENSEGALFCPRQYNHTGLHGGQYGKNQNTFRGDHKNAKVVEQYKNSGRLVQALILMNAHFETKLVALGRGGPQLCQEQVPQEQVPQEQVPQKNWRLTEKYSDICKLISDYNDMHIGITNASEVAWQELCQELINFLRPLIHKNKPTQEFVGDLALATLSASRRMSVYLEQFMLGCKLNVADYKKLFNSISRAVCLRYDKMYALCFPNLHPSLMKSSDLCGERELYVGSVLGQYGAVCGPLFQVYSDARSMIKRDDSVASRLVAMYRAVEWHGVNNGVNCGDRFYGPAIICSTILCLLCEASKNKPLYDEMCGLLGGEVSYLYKDIIVHSQPQDINPILEDKKSLRSWYDICQLELPDDDSSFMLERIVIILMHGCYQYMQDHRKITTLAKLVAQVVRDAGSEEDIKYFAKYLDELNLTCKNSFQKKFYGLIGAQGAHESIAEDLINQLNDCITRLENKAKLKRRADNSSDTGGSCGTKKIKGSEDHAQQFGGLRDDSSIGNDGPLDVEMRDGLSKPIIIGNDGPLHVETSHPHN